MNSAAGKLEAERQKQDEIRKQIAQLQAQLTDIPDEGVYLSNGGLNGATNTTRGGKGKRREESEAVTLAPATPSPKKKRKLAHPPMDPPLAAPNFASRGNSNAKKTFNSSMTHKRPSNSDPQTYQQPGPSNLLSKLAQIRTASANPSEEAEASHEVARTSSFSEKPPPAQHISTGSVKRDDRLVLIEDIPMGPYEHTPPFDDPLFERLEPNSGIKLSSRKMPHEDFHEYLDGRFFVSPSRLYACIRPSSDKQGFDVPVDGDWVTIAVVAEKGPIKLSKAPVSLAPDEGGHRPAWQNKNKPSGAGGDDGDDVSKPRGKKYTNIKLVDFGTRSRSASSATGGKAVIRGDAMLSLLLFESDRYEDIIVDAEGGRGKKEKKTIYRGGSKGAFENMHRFSEGDVIALLNPKVLKPFQRTAAPHPQGNVLALTPESLESIGVIGRAKDFGKCAVMKRDGSPCGSWLDKTVSEVCEWHLQTAVERRKAGRAEFSIGTTGMSTSAVSKRSKNNASSYDPARQWGLKPEPDSGGSTYVVSGHVISGGGGPRADGLYVGENYGREGQAKAKRQSVKGADKELLKKLMERDKEGMKTVLAARVAIKAAKAKEEQKEKGTKQEKEKGTKVKVVEQQRVESEDDDDWYEDEAKENTSKEDESKSERKGAYSAEVIKQLGFDPSLKGSARVAPSTVVRNKLDALTAVQQGRKSIDLRPVPGPKVKSGVAVPAHVIARAKAKELEVVKGSGDRMVDLDDDSD
ncbi:hypothetical protein BDN72DRAFT_957386 [Pluteus cervinus]|uniref:Uncharacterized protein n=1 Tax=Pluteus cervinus TaxID=181527 RepID=A0ACD3B2X0_9AGAR|nr:hypothetical protein BDN72DRAFT_957386 [Pluteus cervinus]